jgi:hypothetical protein
MAYALNNEQPVRCTIISDQPLFYMDFEGDIDDEAEFSALDDTLGAASAMTDRTGGPHTMARDENRTAKIMEEFLSDAVYMTEHHAVADMARDGEFELAMLTRALERSRLAQGFIEVMKRHNGKFVFNDQVETAFYDRATGNIHINPNRPKCETALLAARELRRLWQHRAGALIDPLTFHPDQAILVNRVQIADLAASMVRVAWEMQLAGEKDMWARVENSSMEDLARAFAREAFMDFRTVNNGAANCAVFEAWFLSERCGYEDRRLIQQMLADYQGYVFEADSASVSLAGELIAALGGMPFGKNYLAPYVQTIVSDALFTEVRDRSNANFLWFIKFERSFRETEQELQSGEDCGQDVRSGSSQSKKTKRFGDHETTADIIHLPHGGAGDPIDRDRAVGNRPLSGGAAIIQFRGRLVKGRARE